MSLIDEYKDKLPKPLFDELKKEAESKKITQVQLKKVLEKVMEEYENSLIDPGEAIGVITAESFGEPGTQMCISRDEKIILKFKSRIKIMEIGKFIDQIFGRVKTKKEKNYEIYNVPDELLVLGLDKNEKLKWKKILALNRIKAPERLIKIKTRSGRNITATDFHSFVIRKNNKIVPIAGKELNIGDRIPVMRYLPENCISAITVNDYISNASKQAKSIPNVFELNSLFGWFIGAYLAEGNATTSYVGISNVNEIYINNAKKFAETIGLNYSDRIYEGEFAMSRTLNIFSTLLANFIKCLCNTGSKNKKLPDFAYSAKEEFVSGLLKGYFDGDGNITVSRKMIRASSSSKELIKGVALLLTRFKVFSRISRNKKGQYTLYIPYGYAKLFFDKIGSDVKRKKEQLIELAEISEERKFKSLDQIEMISGFDNLFYDVAKKLGMKIRYINNFTKRQKIGRTALFRYIKKFEILAKEKDIDIEKELKIMKRMFNSDVIWDEIKEIKYVKSSFKYVYDLSVPGLETFTTFEGIVTHNTLNVKHFAGVAEMNVTLGLPRLIEIFDATKNPSTPTMEIYLEKRYNKDPKIVRKIAYRLKETKLEDVASEFLIDVTKLCVKVILDKNKLKDLGLNEKELVSILSKSLRNIQIRQNKNELVLKGKEEALNEVYALKEKARGVFVSGVKRITDVLPVKRSGEFIVLTAGSNLKDVMAIKEVDNTRVMTNDIHEVANVLGIEAGRQAIINEASKVISNQGLDVDIRHIMLIADAMTNKGVIRGITRTGMTGEKESILARASFETPIKHLINAAMTGEVDNLNSVIENVIINQPVPVGTGLPDLVVTKKAEKNE